MNFKSQAGQDEWVCNKLNFKRNGFFIDIGAHDGEYINNTIYLEKELGWNGICVEPDPEMFRALSFSRGCICVNKAIYKESKEVDFVLEQGIRAIDSCLQIPITTSDRIRVEAITMEQLLRENNTPPIIDYVSIDTEGADYDVLLGFPFDKYKVRLWTTEHNAYMDGGVLKAKIRELMLSKGYKVFENKDPMADIFEDWYE